MVIQNPLNLPPPVPAEEVFKPKKTPKQKCEEKGGTWDEATQTCKMPTSEKPTGVVTSKNTSPEEYEAYRISQGFTPTDTSKFGPLRDTETGRLSGFEREGKAFVGANSEQTRDVLEAEANRQELVVGGQAETVLGNREQQQAGLEAAAGVSQTPLDPTSATEQINLNYVNAALSAIPGILPDLVSGAFYGAGVGAGVGAIGGAVGGPGGSAAGATAGASVWAIRGAVLGAVKGFYSGFISDLESQRGAAVEAPIRTLTETKPLLSDIINAQNANPEDRDKHKEQWNIQKQLILDDYDNLKELTDSSVSSFLGENGINQLKEFEVYYAGEAQQLEFEFADALANPDPTKIRATSKDIEAMRLRITGSLS